MKHWIFKSEPGDYSIADLKRDKKSLWTGVRNFQARNFMMNEMKVGDLGFFYHSSCETPGCYGVIRVSATAVADPTQFDPKSDYFDPKASKDKPNWFCVEVSFQSALSAPVDLEQIRNSKKLSNLKILQRGNRLSITPIEKPEFEEILRLGQG